MSVIDKMIHSLELKELIETTLIAIDSGEINASTAYPYKVIYMYKESPIKCAFYTDFFQISYMYDKIKRHYIVSNLIDYNSIGYIVNSVPTTLLDEILELFNKVNKKVLE